MHFIMVSDGKGSAAAQWVERTTPGKEVLSLIPAGPAALPTGWVGVSIM